MTRVEGENTWLRHYLARLHRKTLCYSKSVDMLKHSVPLLRHYLRFGDLPHSKINSYLNSATLKSELSALGVLTGALRIRKQLDT